ncbi:MAG: LysM peptidoglycan-binding domain-containing protein [Chlamydiae bacterium]|nr:LysM peptidoglycan-binding domain-containing protein [Chlamydiota bacterium]
MQRWQKPKDQSLKQAFTLSSEFQAIKTLFNKVSPNIEEDVLIDILCDGSWDIIEKFYQEQSLQADLSEDRRRVFLLDLLTRKSTASARLFLQSDYNYVVKRFDDNHILQMLELIDDKNEHLEKFCQDLLKSPRSNLVLKKSSDRLYKLHNEELPVAFDHNKALEHFGLITKIQPIVLKETSKAPLVKKEEIKTRKHIVQDGENLWKIARKYKVDVQELIKINNLENNKIHPGTEIVLP